MMEQQETTQTVERLEELLEKHTQNKEGLTEVECTEVETLINTLPLDPEVKCWCCYGEKEWAIAGLGLCRNCAHYSYVVRK